MKVKTQIQCSCSLNRDNGIIENIVSIKGDICKFTNVQQKRGFRKIEFTNGPKDEVYR